MLLPNGKDAVVEQEKVVGYLLNATHPDGAAKAEFFLRFGFDPDDWIALATALKRHAVSSDVVKTVENVYGTRYSVDGPLETPDGRCPRVRTVWIIERGGRTPRLITAHPV